MGSVFMAAATLATSTACRAACAAASAVRSTAEAKPQVPSTMTRTARPVSSASNSVSRVAVGQADLLTPDALGAEVGVLRAEALGLRKRRVGQVPQREGGELRVDPTDDHSRRVSLSHPPLTPAVPSGG